MQDITAQCRLLRARNTLDLAILDARGTELDRGNTDFVAPNRDAATIRRVYPLAAYFRYWAQTEVRFHDGRFEQTAKTQSQAIGGRYFFSDRVYSVDALRVRDERAADEMVRRGAVLCVYHAAGLATSFQRGEDFLIIEDGIVQDPVVIRD